MSSFLPVNNQISSPQDRPMEDANTPTPRASASNGAQTKRTSSCDEDTPRNLKDRDYDDPSRPATSSQRATPTAPAEEATLHHESDGEHSDHEPENGSNSNAPPSKKKKGQRFYCTDFPPCNLSFTRSEHLARHIRKHTGERPFQCHCSRRFSRLDNLRQHAQTVHVNEEIPGDSLAAMGTRFQRQIRTDRVRPQGRARAGTGPSSTGHSRGHSRNLSTSSIGSTASTFSQPPEIRRRPTSLIMPHDNSARTRLALDGMVEPPSTPPAQIRGSIPGPSVGGSPYTPSHMFTGAPEHLASPMSTASQASGFWDGKTAARRLSVPAGINPFVQQQPVHAYPPGYVGTPNQTPYAGPGGVYASPVSSNYSRDEAEADLRRRTWHPSTYSAYQRPATSGLSSYQTPDGAQQQQPSFGSANGQAKQHPPRLPGIESFDKVISQQRPLTPPGRRPSPMQVDSGNQQRPAPSYGFGGGFNYNAPAVRPPPPVSGPGHRRGHVSWDLSLHANLTGLNIRDKPFQRDAAQWGQQTIAEIQNVASRPSTSYQPSEHRGNPGPGHCWHSSTASGSSQATRTSPEDSSSSEGVHTPSTASLEYHPAIVHHNGSIEPHAPHHHSALASETPQSGCAPFSSQPNEGDHVNSKHEPRSDLFNTTRDSGMGRLEALVAVATSEDKGAAKLFL
ncbi:hypothetical protein SI65_05722 [Aspergillus cristatus]|uniref:C2H2-type domain-containing protein n=1 Tax=Aspergillus cristatus TaxID=573508 RepID=A0A1E3BDP7_ASPCR|nr:hypothetical protein SI65_05722 [Aspergillus cristatus]